MKELTVQEQLLLEQLHKRYDDALQAGDHLDGKAGTIMQAGSFIIALAVAASIPFNNITATTWGLLGTLLAVGSFLCMIIVSMRAWAPSDYTVLGSAKDEVHLRNRYLDVDVAHCYQLILVNITDAIKNLEIRSKKKARLINWSAGLLAAQVIGIVIFAAAQNQGFSDMIQELLGKLQ